MIYKYGVKWSNSKELQEWLKDEIELIIMNTEYIYHYYKEEKFNRCISKAVNHLIEPYNYTNSGLTQKSFNEIKNNLIESHKEDFKTQWKK